jgi:hypothetical protein
MVRDSDLSLLLVGNQIPNRLTTPIAVRTQEQKLPNGNAIVGESPSANGYPPRNKITHFVFRVQKLNFKIGGNTLTSCVPTNDEINRVFSIRRFYRFFPM